MAKAQYIEKAKKPIYRHGKRVEYISKRGKRAGQTLSKIDRFQPSDEGDEILINVGEPYWTWCFYGGNPIYSKTQPKPSQLTKNPFKQELYSIQESLDNNTPTDADGLSSLVDELRDSLEILRDTCQESFDNIPEQLQESSPAAITLNERIERLDEILGEIDSIDTDFDLDDVMSDYERDTMDNDEWERICLEKEQEWASERYDEICDIDLDIE